MTSGNQFGMSEADVTECIRDREKFPHVTMVGLQYFTGTQKKIMKKINVKTARANKINHSTEMVFILDRSGSMAGLESDTIGGFNAMIEKQI